MSLKFKEAWAEMLKGKTTQERGIKYKVISEILYWFDTRTQTWKQDVISKNMINAMDRDDWGVVEEPKKKEEVSKQTLSENIVRADTFSSSTEVIHIVDVRDFIEKIKQDVINMFGKCGMTSKFCEIIDRRAGEKLTKKE